MGRKHDQRLSVMVPRRAVEVSAETRDAPLPLAHWRGTGAYVLLAEPGAGKTEALKAEERDNSGTYISARDFITLRTRRFDPSLPILIDGLDEIRAGSGSQRIPLDDIRKRLDELGRPRFRLSCREADWRSSVDSERLAAVAPGGKLVELHLEELGDADILTVLRGLEVASPEAFLAEAERQGVRPLLGNPLLLDLIVKAVGTGNDWPPSRSAVYTMACRQLAIEHNDEHRDERCRGGPSTDQLLRDAGMVCALWLLAGISDDARPGGESAVAEDMFPRELGVSDLDAALSSKLFIADGDRRVPRHRTIAEFLAAGAIADRIRQGLPVGRVLALMSGADGGIVDPLRGLYAWLATACPSERRLLIDRDPLGLVLYGDLKLFSKEEKVLVLNALHREAQRFAWFRKGNWEDHPFGALGTADMAGSFHALLTAPERSPAQQSLVECVLDAIKHGDPMPSLVPDLSAIVRDQSFGADLRFAALDAWLKQPEPDWLAFRSLLDDIEQNRISDPNDQLAGRLLGKLYPDNITPKQIAGYFRMPKAEYFGGRYQDFWRRGMLARTPKKDLSDLIDAWASLPLQVEGDRYGLTRKHVAGDLLAAALEAHGDSVLIEALYKWFGIGLDKHGFSRLTDNDAKGARRWLTARPSKLKALVAYGWTQVRTDAASGRRRFWESEARTLGVTRPADWYAWLLEQAAAADDEELARHCFDYSAHCAINPSPDFIMPLESVEEWVRSNRGRWPQASEWLERAWSVPLDHWESEEAKRKKKYAAKAQAARNERRRKFLPHLASMCAGTASAGLMNQIALAYHERYSDIHGDTPVERVQDLLGGDLDEAATVIRGLEATLARTDLPTVDDILKADLTGGWHYIRPACLLGAALVLERDPGAYRSWPDALVGKLVAFWLTEGAGEQPEWYFAAAAQRPGIVAPVLERYAAQSIRRRSVTNVAGLWQLAREDRLAEVARLVVPGLLRVFPIRANERQLRILNGELLPAAIKHLSLKELADLFSTRLALKSLDAAQRIAYLVAGLGVDGETGSRRLLKLVGKSESRAAHVGQALEWQGGRKKSAAALPVSVAGRLMELIAMYASPERPTGFHRVGEADHRRDWAHHFVNQLASAASVDAANEIARLAALPQLARWKLTLEGAAFDQSRAMRDASFRQASVQEVVKVLANQTPANPQDLAALVLDHLRGLEARLRGDDTNGLLLFRRDDRKTSKTENECRDILVDRMRNQLSVLGIHFEKEGQAAQDTRADLRAEFIRPDRRFAVPIEIKKEDKRELWTAWRTQLRTYMLDPACDGIGIYLVLWFGIRARSTPEGRRPSTPDELRELLTAMIPEEDRHRLYVEVLNLSLTE